MKRRTDLVGWIGVLVVLTLVPLLGLAPGAHAPRHALWQAQRARQAGRLLQAARALSQAAALLPERPGLWEEAGILATQGADYALAFACFENASQALPGGLTPAGLLALGQVYAQLGDPDSARLTWERLVALDPKGAPYADLYRLQRRAGALDAAQASLEQLVERQPADAQVWYDLALLQASRDPASALPALARAGQLDAGLVESVESIRQSIRSAQAEELAYQLLNTGRALADLGAWDLAAAAFQRATELRPDFVQAWAYLGEARQQNPPAGLENPGYAELEHALTLDPDSLPVHLFLALYWRRQGNFDLALQAQARALALDADNPILLQGLGELQAASGDLEAAQNSYTQGTRLAPDDPATWRALADFSLRYDYHLQEVALPAARQALVLAPKNVENLDMMGQILTRLNDLQNARRFLEKATLDEVRYAPAHLHLGYVYWLLGEADAAYNQWRQVGELAPGSSAAAQANRLLRTYLP